MRQITSLGSALALKNNKISSPLLAQTLSFQYSLTASLALNSSLKAVWDGGFLGAGPTWPAPVWVVLDLGLAAHSSLGNGLRRCPSVVADQTGGREYPSRPVTFVLLGRSLPLWEPESSPGKWTCL